MLFGMQQREQDSFARSVEQLGAAMLDEGDVKAVMMSFNDDGDIAVSLVKGKDESHKVRLGVIDRRRRTLSCS